MLHVLAALLLLAADPAAPVVHVHFVAEDGKGVAIRNLKAEEVRVLQDGQVQPVLTFEPRPTAGHYVLTYTPASGRAGAVNVRLLRGGSVVRGPDGNFLKPKVVGGSSPLEREMVSLLEAATDVTSGDATLDVYRFEPADDGLHHTVAVHVPLASIPFVEAEGGFQGRVQVLTRVRDAQGVLRYRSAVDRPILADTPMQASVLRLVSTSDLHLPEGTYTVEALVRAPGGAGHARRQTVTVEPRTAGLSVSSLVLLQESDVLVAQSDSPAAHDPLTWKGAPLMPTVAPSFTVGARARARFFFVAYPHGPGPTTAELEVWRGGERVGGVAVPLPPADADGAIRHVAGVPTHTFRPADYTLRLKVRQGAAEVQREASFAVVPMPDPVRIRER